MRKTLSALAVATLIALPGLSAAPAQAQVVTLGSTATGGTSQIGRSIAAAVSEYSPLQMRPQEMANTADYMPLVNIGEIDFGISNVVQLWYAHHGLGMSEGTPMGELRNVASLMPFRAGFIVPADSDVRTMEDLEGMRVPGFAEGTLGYHVTLAYLANGGLTYDDVVEVPVPNFPRMWDAFREGSIDVSIVVVGSGNNIELDQTLGGVRFISFTDDEERLEAMQEWLPQMYFAEVGPDEGIPGIDEPTNIKVYDYTLFAPESVSDDLVYEVTKSLYENEELLVAAGPVWAGFTAEGMARDVDVPFHPGAIRFYEEVGAWDR
ncbi:MAG: TAXI family TRAP transporter solute-binding subunit [Salinarimonas sp.]|nr:TAXI family TRAP transporter solute-binding subunit [Salinarimonas sp.]